MFLSRLIKTLLTASCTQLSYVDLQVCVSGSTFLGEAGLGQILYKVPLLSHFTFHGNVVIYMQSARICPLTQQDIIGQIKFVTMAMTEMSHLNTCTIQLDVISLLLKKDYRSSAKEMASYLFCGL